MTITNKKRKEAEKTDTKIKSMKIKSNNFTKSNRAKPNIAVTILEKEPEISNILVYQ